MFALFLYMNTSDIILPAVNNDDLESNIILVS